MVRSHHERFDGTGYPRGLKGEAIPLGARIVAVAEGFEMLVQDRPHRGERAFAAARAQIQDMSTLQISRNCATTLESQVGRS
jgi:putative two-component system response regulator